MIEEAKKRIADAKLVYEKLRTNLEAQNFTKNYYKFVSVRGGRLQTG